MRLQRNKWITKCRAYKTRNIGTSLNIPNELCRIYAQEDMKVKLFFVNLDNDWPVEIVWTSEMIKTLLTLWYYRIIKCIYFAVGIYLTSKFFELEEVMMDSKVRKNFRGLNMTEIEEEIHAAYLQEAETYSHDSLFPMFLLESPFAVWEIRDDLCQKRLHPSRFDTYLKILHFIRNELPCECCYIGANPIYPNPFDQV